MPGYSPAPLTGGAEQEAPLKPTGARADIKKKVVVVVVVVVNVPLLCYASVATLLLFGSYPDC